MSKNTSLSIELVKMWINQWADEQSEIEEPDSGDLEERKIIKAAQQIIKELNTVTEDKERFRSAIQQVIQGKWSITGLQEIIGEI